MHTHTRIRTRIRIRMLEPNALSGLLQLSSAALPIGAFSHSLGLEAAVNAGVIQDLASAESWICDHLELLWARGEAPLWLALYQAWQQPDFAELQRCNDRVLATRESQELLLECTQTGHSLRQWLLALPALELQTNQRDALLALQPVAYLTVHALASRTLGLCVSTGLHALAWSLLENLGSAALKLVPLGQTQGQALLRRLSLRLGATITEVLSDPEREPQNFSPMLGILSAQHESQYSRLFRS